VIYENAFTQMLTDTVMRQRPGRQYIRAEPVIDAPNSPRGEERSEQAFRLFLVFGFFAFEFVS
jgi:hypothetical protein